MSRLNQGRYSDNTQRDERYLPTQQQNQSWIGDFRDFYRAPEVFEPNYENYRYYSKFSVLDPESPYGGQVATYFKVSEIHSILSRVVIDDPFNLYSDEFVAPEIVQPKMPSRPADPRDNLLCSAPLPVALPAQPQAPIANAYQFNILGLKISPLNRVLTRGRQREMNE